jgi:hypothetical protein
MYRTSRMRGPLRKKSFRARKGIEDELPSPTMKKKRKRRRTTKWT